MPKQRRAAASRSPARPVAKKSTPAKRKAPKALTLSKGAKASKTTASRPTGPKVQPPTKSQRRDKAPAGAAVTARVRALTPKPPEPKEVPAPAPPPRRPAFYEALAVYETGVRALQRHDFEAAANSLRSVIQGYPGERELVERARLYLQVCERETARRPSGPQTAVGIRLRGDGRVERRRRGRRTRTSRQGPREGTRERSRALYYGCCPSRQG